MTDNPHQRRLERDAAQQKFIDLRSDRSEFWEDEARRYASVADALLKHIASRVSKSSLRYDQDGD